MWKTFVALGDSMTEGIGDEVNGIKKKSWPTYIAEFFNIEKFSNLAKSGLRSDEIYKEQLETALSMNPDIVSIMAGGNDFIQRKWNAKSYREIMDKMISKFTENGIIVITSNFPDLTQIYKFPFYLLPIAKYQLKTCNKILDELATKYNTVHIDFWNNPISKEIIYWSNDRIHPNSHGYKVIGDLIISELNKKYLYESKDIIV